MDLKDPALLQAANREQWRKGSAVEIFSESERRWHVGVVTAEDQGGALQILFDDRSPSLKFTTLRRDDPKLAPVGTNVRKAPLNFEVINGRSSPMLVHRLTSRGCATLEEAYVLHIEALRRQGPSSSPQVMPQSQGYAQSQGLHPVREMEVLQTPTFEGDIHSCQAALADKDSLVWHLKTQLREITADRDRLQELCDESKNIREERDNARMELSEVRLEYQRLAGHAPPSWRAPVEDSAARPGSATIQNTGRPRSPRAVVRTNVNGRPSASVGDCHSPDSPDLSAALRPVQSEKGRPALGSSARERRSSERPVEIRVSVPRALTPDEMASEVQQPREEARRTVPPARSLRSLVQDPQRVAQHVVRLPSAPLVNATGPHVMTAGMQNIQVAGQPPPVCVIATTAHTTAPVGTMPPAGTTARLLAQGGQTKIITLRR